MEKLITDVHELFERERPNDENDDECSDLSYQTGSPSIGFHKDFVYDLRVILEKYKSNQRDWQKYTLFHPLEYTRNLVDAGNGQFNLIILCWGPGQFSQIHNHTDSHCFVKVLQGQLLETRYACPKEGDEAGAPLVEIGIDIHPTNAITYINDQIGLHRMENNSHTDNAVTLHLYTPPLTHCHLFDLRTGKRDNSIASYHTEFGRRTNKMDAKF